MRCIRQVYVCIAALSFLLLPSGIDIGINHH